MINDSFDNAIGNFLLWIFSEMVDSCQSISTKNMGLVK